MRIELEPSYRLAAALCCAHAAAAACVLALLPTVAGGALAAALAALGIAAAWARALHRSGRSVRAIELSADKAILQLRDGHRVEVRIPARRYVGRWLVALPVRGPMRRTVLVTADMARGDLFRVLRIWAAWGRTPAPASGQAAV